MIETAGCGFEERAGLGASTLEHAKRRKETRLKLRYLMGFIGALLQVVVLHPYQSKRDATVFRQIPAGDPSKLSTHSQLASVHRLPKGFQDMNNIGFYFYRHISYLRRFFDDPAVFNDFSGWGRKISLV